MNAYTVLAYVPLFPNISLPLTANPLAISTGTTDHAGQKYIGDEIAVGEAKLYFRRVKKRYRPQVTFKM